MFKHDIYNSVVTICSQIQRVLLILSLDISCCLRQHYFVRDHHNNMCVPLWNLLNAQLSHSLEPAFDPLWNPSFNPLWNTSFNLLWNPSWYPSFNPLWGDSRIYMTHNIEIHSYLMNVVMHMLRSLLSVTYISKVLCALIKVTICNSEIPEL